MKRAHRKTLEALFAHPTSAKVAWKDIEALLTGLGAEVSEREGSRVAVILFNEVRASIDHIRPQKRTRAL